MERIKSFLAVVLILSLLLGGFTMPVLAQVSDITGHWAESQIKAWLEKGWASGYSDGSFRPNASVTRAEFMTLANKAFGFNESVSINFSDVKTTDWYYGEIAKAKAAGYISGYEDGTIRPKNFISRQEAAAMLARILKLDTSGELNALEKFTDKNSIPTWSKGAIAAVVAEGIMSGYPDGTFRATENITRAEAIVMLDNAVSTTVIYDEEGIYGPANEIATIQGNVVIAADGVILRNVTVTGDLLIAEEVGDGDVKLQNVAVKGEVVVKGGGSNSVEFEDCDIPKITVNKDGVRLVASGNTRVRVVALESGATLVQATVAGSGFEEVTITEQVPSNAKITLAGNFEKVELAASKVAIELTEGSISTLNVAEKAEDATITVASGAKVDSMTISAPVEVKGQGTIVEANVNNPDVKFEKEPEKVNKSEEVKEQEKEEKKSSKGGSSGGGSGGGTSPIQITSINIRGDVKVGGTLTAEVTLAGATVNYQWLRSESEHDGYIEINGATSKTYTLVADDIGKWIKVKATGTGNYRGTVESSPVGPVFAEATLEQVGSVGIHEGKIYEGYQLKVDGQQIPLVTSNIKEVTVLEPGSDVAKPLTVVGEDDPLLWFNVQKDSGEYKYTVVTNDGKVYVATIDWRAPEEVSAEATGKEGYHGSDYYVEFKLGDLDLSSFEKMYQIKPDGKIYELTANTDSNLWFKVTDQVIGEHVFLVKKDGTWYKTTIAYPIKIEKASFEAVNKYGINDNKVYAAYELKDKDGIRIPLIVSNIQRVVLKYPDGKVTELEVVGDTDPYLWFNIANTPGIYTYTIFTKESKGEAYEATIDWKGPVEAKVKFKGPDGAEAVFTAAEGDKPAQVDFSKVTVDKLLNWSTQDKPNYYAIELEIKDVDLSEENVKYAFRVYEDGTAIEPEIKGDLNAQYVTTDWKTGLATMYYVLADYSLYQAKINVVSLEPKTPEHSEYGFEVVGADQKFIANGLLSGSVIEGKDGLNTAGLTPVYVTLKATKVNELGYERVRILPPEITGGNGTLQLWAYSEADGKWFDTAVHGWGSGFPITTNYEATTPIYVFAEKPGVYTITFKLVDLDNNNNNVIAEATITIRVEDPAMQS